MSVDNATLPSMPPWLPGSLSVSIVVYRLNAPELARNLETLRAASARLAGTPVALALVDNSEAGELAGPLRAIALSTGWPGASIITGHGNVGYGAGHNLAIRESSCDAHLVLNPDVEMDAGALASGLCTLALDGVVLVGAVGRDAAGAPAYLSKRLPSVWLFFLRGFAPLWLKRGFARQLAHYEYHDLPNDCVSEVRLVSGAFMLCRLDALRAVAGFDERYFLHFEDFDLSLRLGAQGRVVSDPGVTLVHHGGHSARRGWAHLRLFLRSAFRFFGTHGWRLF